MALPKREIHSGNSSSSSSSVSLLVRAIRPFTLSRKLRFLSPSLLSRKVCFLGMKCRGISTFLRWREGERENCSLQQQRLETSVRFWLYSHPPSLISYNCFDAITLGYGRHSRNQCHECNSYGHWAKDCPQRRDFRSDKYSRAKYQRQYGFNDKLAPPNDRQEQPRRSDAQ